MPPPPLLPVASHPNIASDHRGDNDAGCDGDDEEGEPPSIPRPGTLFKREKSESNILTSESPLVVTANEPRRRLRTHRRSQSAARRRGGRGAEISPRRGAAALVAIWLCLSASCRADDRANDISWRHKEGVRGLPLLLEEESTGLRGAARDAFADEDEKNDDAAPSGKCSYECCSSFPDVLPQNGGHSEHGEYINQRGMRSEASMLQEGTTAATDPCPSGKEGSEGEGGVSIPAAAQYLLIVILVVFSALFSGLTLGLMSLDPSGLEVVMASDDPRMARAAKAIYPVRLNGNLLLCTLLLGNVGVNSLLSILMADLTSGLVGFIVSTCVIVVFGEIIPQAICSRFALAVGEKTVPMVKVIMVLLYPICKPLSVILNKVLGREIGTTYSASEMAKLIEMHVQRGELEGTTGAAMTGALRYRGVAVSEVMTPLENTFMLAADERLGFDVVAKIFKTGYSRIPVYEVSTSNIIGLLFVKDLIFLDPEDEIPVKNFVQIFGRGLHVVWPDDKLGDVLKLLKRGRSHMALVRGTNEGDGERDPYYEIKGIITLEDIIEMILGDEIVDETDELVDVNDPRSVVRRSSDVGGYIEGPLESSDDSRLLVGEASGGALDWEARLRLLDERLVDEHLSPDEVRAVAAHLKTNYSRAVELISDRQLKEVLSSVPVTEVPPASTCTTDDDGGGDGSGVPTDASELIYERGVPAEFCTVVLSGRITVMSGADRFRSDVSNWGVLASRALTDPDYVPDFSAWVVPNQNGTGGCRCIKLDRKSHGHAVDNTALEKTDRKAERAPTALATSAAVTNGSPIPMVAAVTSAIANGKNANADKGSQRRKEIGSSLSSALDNLPRKDAEGKKQDERSTSLPNRMPANTGPGAHSYVRTNTQKSRQSRRSKLLKAFSRATKDVEKE